MVDWLLNLPVSLLALIVFLGTYLVAGCVYFIVTKLAATEWGRAFKGVSPGMLPPLGILFALLIGFIAVEVWNNFDKAKSAVAAEASALRAVVLLAGTLPDEQRSRLNGLINRHIEVAVKEEWPEMVQHRATLSLLPTALIEALHYVLAQKPGEDSARTAQPEMVRALHAALDARRQRIVVSEAAVGSVKWVGILLQALCTLVAIAMVHSDNRRACAIALTLFATGVALSVLLIAAYSRPFTGGNSVSPELLKQVIASERAHSVGTSAPKSALAQDTGKGNWLDLTHAFNENSVYWPTAKMFSKSEVFHGHTSGGWFYAAYNFEAAEHGGTHIDAPIHFAEGKETTDRVPLDRLIGPGIVMDVEDQASANVDYLVGARDITDFEARHGRIAAGSIVLINTGRAKYYGDRKRYMGTDERGEAAVSKLHFPGLGADGAALLIERGVAAVGIDTPSIDHGQSKDFAAHVKLMTNNVPAFENVADMSALPETGSVIVALPMKIEGGSGGPLRIIARLPD